MTFTYFFLINHMVINGKYFLLVIGFDDKLLLEIMTNGNSYKSLILLCHKIGEAMGAKNIMKKLVLSLMIVIFLILSNDQSAMAAEKLNKKDFIAKYNSMSETYNLYESLNSYGEDVILFTYDKNYDSSKEAVVKTARGIYIGMSEASVTKKYGKGTKEKLSKDIVYNRMLYNAENMKPYFKNIKYVVCYQYKETTDDGSFISRIHFYIDKEGKVALIGISRINGDSKGDYLHYFQKGSSAYLSEDYDEAIEYYTQALKRNKEDPLVYNGLGNCYFRLEEYGEAIKYYWTAIELDSKDAYYQYNMGNALYQQKKYEEAIPYLSECIKLVPKFTDAYTTKGDCLYYLGRFEDAVEYYDIATNLPSGDTAYVYYSKGAALYGLGKFADAITAYNQAIEKDPTYTVAYADKGNALCDLEMYEEARIEYDKALKLYPKSTYSIVGKGKSYYYQGKFKEAIELYDQAISLDPADLNIYAWKAYALFDMGSYEDCLTIGDKMLQLDPADGFGYYIKGRVYAVQQKDTECFDNLKKAVERNKIYIEYAEYDWSFSNYKSNPSYIDIISGKDK